MAKKQINWEEIIEGEGAEDVLEEVVKYISPAAIGDVLYHQLDNDDMLKMLLSIQILKDSE